MNRTDKILLACNVFFGGLNFWFAFHGHHHVLNMISLGAGISSTFAVGLAVGAFLRSR